MRDFTLRERVRLETLHAEEMHALLRRLWTLLDNERSRDARYMSPAIREAHDEMGTLLRRLRGGREEATSG